MLFDVLELFQLQASNECPWLQENAQIIREYLDYNRLHILQENAPITRECPYDQQMPHRGIENSKDTIQTQQTSNEL